MSAVGSEVGKDGTGTVAGLPGSPLAALHSPLSYSMKPQSDVVRSKVMPHVTGEKTRDTRR